VKRAKRLREKQTSELKALADSLEEHIDKSVAKTNADLKLEVGAKVRMLSNPSQAGEVLSIDGKEIEVLFGSLKMRTKPAQLEVISSAEARREERKQATTVGSFYDEMFKPRIDLRGKYGDEGVMEVEKFIHDANARGLNKVEILHGTGSGALGRRIQQYLRSEPIVASFRFGERTEGGMGVTIVELK
jgi:DNA mismatch repair protein MutS2